MKTWRWNKIVRSKTLWVNAIAFGALLVQQKYGYVVDPEAQATALLAVNGIVRFFTNEALIVED